jgi:hypothetical protein
LPAKASLRLQSSGGLLKPINALLLSICLILSLGNALFSVSLKEKPPCIPTRLPSLSFLLRVVPKSLAQKHGIIDANVIIEDGGDHLKLKKLELSN